MQVQDSRAAPNTASPAVYKVTTGLVLKRVVSGAPSMRRRLRPPCLGVRRLCARARALC